jgi:hypothetical protein
VRAPRKFFSYTAILFLLFTASCGDHSAPLKTVDSVVPGPPKDLTISDVIFEIQQMLPEPPEIVGGQPAVKSAGEIWDTSEYHKKRLDPSYRPADPDKDVYRTPGNYFGWLNRAMSDSIIDFRKLTERFKSNYDGSCYWEESMMTNYSDGKTARLLLGWLECVRPQFMKKGWAEKEVVLRKNLERIAGTESK